MVINTEYPIGQVARRVGVSKTTLSLWEKQNLIPRARRKLLTKARFWTESQIQQILEFVRSNY